MWGPQVRILSGAPISCKVGHCLACPGWTSAASSRTHSMLVAHRNDNPRHPLFVLMTGNEQMLDLGLPHVGLLGLGAGPCQGRTDCDRQRANRGFPTGHNPCFQGHPLCRPACRSAALATTAASAVMARGEKGHLAFFRLPTIGKLPSRCTAGTDQ